MGMPGAIIALLVEKFFGYPRTMQNLFGHPVEWMGALISWFSKNLNWGAPKSRRLAGFFMLAVLLACSLMLALAAGFLLSLLPFGWLWQAIIASAFLSQNHLAKAVNGVAAALKVSIEEARIAVSHIVGRDVSSLERAEISRGAIETLAENASDGFIAPLFYLIIFGLPGIVVYKAINTADSMVGHLSEEYSDFGYASAKLDDVVNWVPARICALLFIVAAFIFSFADGERALKTILRDGPKHRSPNAGWPEAAMAGALGFGLGGVRSYKGQKIDLPQMGDGRRELNEGDIELALKLYKIMGHFTLISMFFTGSIFFLLQY